LIVRDRAFFKLTPTAACCDARAVQEESCMMGDRLFVACVFLFGVSCIFWLVIDGLRSGGVLAIRGTMRTWGSAYKIDRQKQPLSYWSLMGLCFVAALVQFVFLVVVVFFAH
jgi:hypothetical protein